MDNSDNYRFWSTVIMVQEELKCILLYRIEYEKFTNEAHVKEWEHYWNLVLLMMEH
jgi:hypothetical protein